MIAGIGPQDPRHRTGVTKLAAPGQRRRGRFQQAALFVLAPAIIVAIEVLAFFPGRGPHNIFKVISCADRKVTGGLKLDARDVAASAGVDANGIPNFNKTGHLHL